LDGIYPAGVERVPVSTSIELRRCKPEGDVVWLPASALEKNFEPRAYQAQLSTASESPNRNSIRTQRQPRKRSRSGTEFSFAWTTEGLENWSILGHQEQKSAQLAVCYPRSSGMRGHLQSEELGESSGRDSVSTSPRPNS